MCILITWLSNLELYWHYFVNFCRRERWVWAPKAPPSLNPPPQCIALWFIVALLWYKVYFKLIYMIYATIPFRPHSNHPLVCYCYGYSPSLMLIFIDFSVILIHWCLVVIFCGVKSMYCYCRAIKTKGNTPKYGLIFHSTFIGRAGAKNKGRISRYLANKCSIASRIDCFSGTKTQRESLFTWSDSEFISKIAYIRWHFVEFPTQVFGDHLKQQVEDRLKFLDTGEAPQKNIDVMKEATQEVSIRKCLIFN
jgi:hypothetical protein